MEILWRVVLGLTIAGLIGLVLWYFKAVYGKPKPEEDDPVAKFVRDECWRTKAAVYGQREPDGSSTITYADGTVKRILPGEERRRPSQ